MIMIKIIVQPTVMFYDVFIHILMLVFLMSLLHLIVFADV